MAQVSVSGIDQYKFKSFDPSTLNLDFTPSAPSMMGNFNGGAGLKINGTNTDTFTRKIERDQLALENKYLEDELRSKGLYEAVMICHQSDLSNPIKSFSDQDFSITPDDYIFTGLSVEIALQKRNERVEEKKVIDDIKRYRYLNSCLEYARATATSIKSSSQASNILNSDRTFFNNKITSYNSSIDYQDQKIRLLDELVAPTCGAGAVFDISAPIGTSHLWEIEENVDINKVCGGTTLEQFIDDKNFSELSRVIAQDPTYGYRDEKALNCDCVEAIRKKNPIFPDNRTINDVRDKMNRIALKGMGRSLKNDFALLQEYAQDVSATQECKKFVNQKFKGLSGGEGTVQTNRICIEYLNENQDKFTQSCAENNIDQTTLDKRLNELLGGAQSFSDLFNSIDEQVKANSRLKISGGLSANAVANSLTRSPTHKVFTHIFGHVIKEVQVDTKLDPATNGAKYVLDELIFSIMKNDNSMLLNLDFDKLRKINDVDVGLVNLLEDFAKRSGDFDDNTAWLNSASMLKNAMISLISNEIGLNPGLKLELSSMEGLKKVKADLSNKSEDFFEGYNNLDNAREVISKKCEELIKKVDTSLCSVSEPTSLLSKDQLESLKNSDRTSFQDQEFFSYSILACEARDKKDHYGGLDSTLSTEQFRHGERARSEYDQSIDTFDEQENLFTSIQTTIDRIGDNSIELLTSLHNSSSDMKYSFCSGVNQSIDDSNKEDDKFLNLLSNTSEKLPNLNVVSVDSETVSLARLSLSDIDVIDSQKRYPLINPALSFEKSSERTVMIPGLDHEARNAAANLGRDANTNLNIATNVTVPNTNGISANDTDAIQYNNKKDVTFFDKQSVVKANVVDHSPQIDPSINIVNQSQINPQINSVVNGIEQNLLPEKLPEVSKMMPSEIEKVIRDENLNNNQIEELSKKENMLEYKIKALEMEFKIKELSQKIENAQKNLTIDPEAEVVDQVQEKIPSQIDDTPSGLQLNSGDKRAVQFKQNRLQEQVFQGGTNNQHFDSSPAQDNVDYSPSEAVKTVSTKSTYTSGGVRNVGNGPNSVKTNGKSSGVVALTSYSIEVNDVSDMYANPDDFNKKVLDFFSTNQDIDISQFYSESDKVVTIPLSNGETVNLNIDELGLEVQAIIKEKVKVQKSQVGALVGEHKGRTPSSLDTPKIKTSDVLSAEVTLMQDQLRTYTYQYLKDYIHFVTQRE